MDDYIFLIIAVVISIFAALKKNKKKEEATLQKQQAEPSRHFLFDQLLGDVQKEEPDDEFDFPDWPAMEPEKEKVAQPAAMPEQPKPYDIPRQAFKSHLPERRKTGLQVSVKKVVEEEELVETEEAEATAYLEDFSLRKAIIYSEILKPKFEGGQTTLF